MSSLGENIKLLCEVNGVTMRELSEKADLCVETIRDPAEQQMVLNRGLHRAQAPGSS